MTPSPSPRDTRLARVLLVDDNEADVALCRLVLIEQSQLQCEVLTARNGKEALRLMREGSVEGHPIDLVLLDINMPIMSGYEVLAQLYLDEAFSKTSVVMCSTSDNELDRRLAVSMGATGYMVKPPRFPDLRTLLEKNPNLRLEQQGDHYALLRAA